MGRARRHSPGDKAGLVVLAVICPPLAVILDGGDIGAVVVTFVLTFFLLHIPGIIYAWYFISKSDEQVLFLEGRDPIRTSLRRKVAAARINRPTGLLEPATSRPGPQPNRGAETSSAPIQTPPTISSQRAGLVVTIREQVTSYKIRCSIADVPVLVESLSRITGCGNAFLSELG